MHQTMDGAGAGAGAGRGAGAGTRALAGIAVGARAEGGRHDHAAVLLLSNAESDLTGTWTDMTEQQMYPTAKEATRGRTEHAM